MHGKEGLGKTHLLLAIYNCYKKMDPKKNCLYIKAKDFNKESIKEKDKAIDTILIDDIDKLGGEETQKKLLNIIDNLEKNNKQIIITSEVEATRLTGFSNKLITKLLSFVNVNIDRNDNMDKREELKRFLIKVNNGNKYIPDKKIIEYYQRLSKAYIKNNKVKRFIYQYLEGDGNELISKFFNVYSSSRLCFEMYSWMANDPSIADIEFEYHLPSMRSSSNFKLRGSNMDVYYKKDDDIYFIESKFTEVVNNKLAIIPDAFYKERGEALSQKGIPLKSDLYYRFNNNITLVRLFPDFVKDVINYINIYADNKKDFFDVKQEIAHIFGICNFIYKNKEKIRSNIHFYNVIYNFDNEVSMLAVMFKKRVSEFMGKFLKELNLNITFEYDYRYMQALYENISDDRLAFGSDKKVKEILKDYFNEEFDYNKYIINKIKDNDNLTVSDLVKEYNIGYDLALDLIMKKELGE